MSGTTQLIFTLDGDQGQIAANFGPYLPIQVAGTLQDMLNTIEAVEISVSTASAAATTATTNAANASSSATAAANSATQAGASATNASASASAAATSATQAANSASSLAGAVSSASSSATAASNSAAQAATTVANAAPLTPANDNVLSLGTASYRYANMYAVTFNGVATSAQYADLAERYEADCYLEPGDVVMLGGEKEITKTCSALCPNVFGVVSTAPAFKMNAGAGDDSTHPYIAFAGRIPVKVIGKAKKGQRLVASSIPGVAMAVDTSEVTNPFVVIGRVLQGKQSDGIELIEAVVGAK